jgi:hypothetical protein
MRVRPDAEKAMLDPPLSYCLGLRRYRYHR